MHNISEYINEARAGSGPVEIEYTPKDRDELITAIQEVAKAQSRRKVLNFNCIDTSAVVNMEYIFYHALCAVPVQLNKDFIVDQWDVSHVGSFDNAFYRCTGFTGKGLKEWNVTRKCKNMANMFNTCLSLQEIDMRKWDLSEVTNVNNMFYLAKNLQSVQFPETMLKLEKMTYTFGCCDSLTYVKLPKKVLGDMLYTEGMFHQSASKYNRLVVDNLDSIILTKTDIKNLGAYHRSMFYQCGIMPEILREYVKGQNLSDKDMELLGIDMRKL